MGIKVKQKNERKNMIGKDECIPSPDNDHWSKLIILPYA